MKKKLFDKTEKSRCLTFTALQTASFPALLKQILINSAIKMKNVKVKCEIERQFTLNKA